MKYNSICVDSNREQCEWGKVKGVYLNGGCSATCVSGYGVAKQEIAPARTPTSVLATIIIAMRMPATGKKCSSSVAVCFSTFIFSHNPLFFLSLYEKGTLRTKDQPCFDYIMDTSYDGEGDVVNT